VRQNWLKEDKQLEELELGTLLQKARKNKGLTIDQIQEETKIRKKYLEAIENNDFDVLPGAVYLKVFVKGYARIVDLNYQALLDNYPVLHQVEEKEKNVSQDYLSSTSIRRRGGKYKSFKNILKWVFFILLGLVLILGAVFAYQYFTNAELRLLNQEQVEETISNQENQEQLNGGSENNIAENEAEKPSQSEGNNVQETLTNEENQLEKVNNSEDKETADGETSLNQVSENKNSANTSEEAVLTESAGNEGEESSELIKEQNAADQQADNAYQNDLVEETAVSEQGESADSQNDLPVQTEENVSQTENNTDSNQQTDNMNQNQESAVEVNDGPNSREENSSLINKNTEQTAEQAEVVKEITINNSERVWLSISADGENVYSGILEVEENPSYEFEDRLYMKIGLARAVTVNLDGREYGPFQSEAEIAEVEFLLRDNEIIFNNLRVQ